jgi:MFS transporter, SHS family, sialic acid transporter
MSSPSTSSKALTLSSRIIIVVAAFLGWGFAGVHMSIISIVMRVSIVDLMPEGIAEGVIGQWFGWSVVAFLFGAAVGGYVFGIVGDRFGRARAMAASILCYSLFSAATYFADSPTSLLVLRFLTCLGIGGMWPNGIALIAEAWPNVSRPILAGVMGTSANVGILLFAILTLYFPVTSESVIGPDAYGWRWTFLFAASPVLVAVFTFFCVPESPSWLALKQQGEENKEPAVGLGEIFQSGLRKTTIVGILLGTIPLFGGWGVANWASAWASEHSDLTKKQVDAQDQNAAEKSDDKQEPQKKSDPREKSRSVIARSLPGSVTSLLGGAIAALIGRRLSYGLMCVLAFTCTQFLFRVTEPSSTAAAMFNLDLGIFSWAPSEFIFWQSALGFCSGFFFGWLPLCLPEMFPTRVRSTGAGVSFNWGRILTGIGIIVSALALREKFQGEYSSVGMFSGFVYIAGLAVILIAPTADQSQLDDTASNGTASD